MTHPYLAATPPIGFAHRGAHGPASNAGENSFEAFAAAVELGFTHLETDVHRTADGVVVALHDETLDRTTDGEGLVAQRAWGEVQRLTVAGGGRVPRLDELLATWPHVRWNLDCKHPATVPQLVEVLRRASALDRVCVGSFEHDTLASLRSALGPGLCSSCSPREVRVLVASSRLPRLLGGVLARVVRADCVQVPVRDGRVEIVTEAFVATCHAAGLPVHVWTIDEPDEMARLLDLGVDGLMTDRPRVLVDVLSARGAWPPDADSRNEAR